MVKLTLCKLLYDKQDKLNYGCAFCKVLENKINKACYILTPGQHNSLLKIIKQAAANDESLFSENWLFSTDDYKYLKAFDLIDSDRDGSITTEELIKVIEKVGGCMTEDEARALIRKADADKNGFVDFTEFSNLWASLKGGDDVSVDKTQLRNFYISTSLERYQGWVQKIWFWQKRFHHKR